MSLGISTAQLTKMRSQVEELLPDTCVIQSSANSTDSMGGVTLTYTAVSGGTVACRVDPLGNRTAQLELYAERETLKVLQQLTVPYDAPLLSNYRVVVGSNTYEVVIRCPAQLERIQAGNHSGGGIMGTQFSRVKVDMKVLRQITAAAPEKALMVMQKIAQDVEADIKENFSAESPSAPGDPPGVDTGALKNGIRAVRANRDTWTVKCDEIFDYISNTPH